MGNRQASFCHRDLHTFVLHLSLTPQASDRGLLPQEEIRGELATWGRGHKVCQHHFFSRWSLWREVYRVDERLSPVTSPPLLFVLCISVKPFCHFPVSFLFFSGLSPYYTSPDPKSCFRLFLPPVLFILHGSRIQPLVCTFFTCCPTENESILCCTSTMKSNGRVCGTDRHLALPLFFLTVFLRS